MTANVRQGELLNAEPLANLHERVQIASCPRPGRFKS